MMKKGYLYDFLKDSNLIDSVIEHFVVRSIISGKIEFGPDKDEIGEYGYTYQVKKEYFYDEKLVFEENDGIKRVSSIKPKLDSIISDTKPRNEDIRKLLHACNELFDLIMSGFNIDINTFENYVDIQEEIAEAIIVDSNICKLMDELKGHRHAMMEELKKMNFEIKKLEQEQKENLHAMDDLIQKKKDSCKQGNRKKLSII